MFADGFIERVIRVRRMMSFDSRCGNLVSGSSRSDSDAARLDTTANRTVNVLNTVGRHVARRDLAAGDSVGDSGEFFS